MLSVILDIILIILKIIGIALLVILGLILLLILVVLFVPIRYNSSGAFKKNDQEVSYSLSANVSWLLHLVSVSFSSKDKENVVKLKILGINLMKPKKKVQSKKKEVSKKEDRKKTKVEYKENKAENDKSENKPMKTETIIKETKVVSKETVTETKEAVENKKGFKDKIKGIFDKISQICDKIKNVNEVKNSFIVYLKADKSKVAIREIKHIILKVLKHVLPQKLKARVKFGFEDPATTGNILGVTSILYGVYGDKLELEPDFEHQVLEGEYSLKGRIRIITLLVAAWKLFRNKWIKDFISFSKKSVQGL